ncbi:YggU-like protein [Apiospora kogelbergensis]|uniref:YggU-like protein n=1 Tax=Apiospora kogelbergensis TaxID=1337665 RepID=A0AAW0QT71_9PEZI
MATRTPLPALSLVRGKSNAPSSLHIRCHVKPGADKVREGILAVSDAAVELCVAAAPRNGESNKAVVQVLSHALQIPKMHLRIVRGLKSRDKTIELSSRLLQTTDEAKLQDAISAIRKRLKDESDP